MKKRDLLIVFLLSLVMVLALTACGDQAQKAEATEAAQVAGPAFTGKYIVEAGYVKDHISDENVILVDARGEETARKGTIEGATATTWQYLSNVENAAMGDYDWGVILEPEALSQKLSSLGWAKDKEIIFFAEGPKGWGEDGRLLWTLLAAGYENVKMVNGGLKALEDAGLPTAKEVKVLEPVEVTVDTLDRTRVINTKELEETYKDYVIVDVRADEEYGGAVLYGEAKGGKLPGAIQVRFTDMFDADGYLKSNEDLTAMFESANIKKTDKVTAYCTAGIRSAYMQLVLEMLDYEHSKNYEGSYYTWCVNNEVE